MCELASSGLYYILRTCPVSELLYRYNIVSDVKLPYWITRSISVSNVLVKSDLGNCLVGIW